MVYIDNMFAQFGRMKMCHMMADSTNELLAMVDLIGVDRKWIQEAGTYHEHFDISSAKRLEAIKHGAMPITMDEVGDMLLKRRMEIAMKLKEIIAGLIHQAEAEPTKSFMAQLGGGMQVHVVVKDRYVTLGVSRAGVSPSQIEMVTTLKHANAPEVNQQIGKWLAGGKGDRLYVLTSWALPVPLQEVVHD